MATTTWDWCYHDQGPLTWACESFVSAPFTGCMGIANIVIVWMIFNMLWRERQHRRPIREGRDLQKRQELVLRRRRERLLVEGGGEEIAGHHPCRILRSL